MHLRHLAGVWLTDESGDRHQLVEPDYDQLAGDSNLPEISAEELTPELIRAAILRHGSLLVRGLLDSDGATHLAGEIDRSFEARHVIGDGGTYEEGYYEDLIPVPPYHAIEERYHVAIGGGVLAADSPHCMFEMVELFEQAKIRDLVEGYLGERPTVSAHKTTLRKAEPTVPGAWHQDGKFLGDVNTLNLWVSLSHCGDTAPGMDLVPRRLEEIVEAGAGAADGFESIVVTQERAEEVAGDAEIVRPIFEPGDAMFFDHLFLHQTASDPSMPNVRYAVESWFFGPSAFPEDYIPLAY